MDNHEPSNTPVPPGPPDAGDPLLGSRVGGFEVESLLGKGGMGSVYRARQVSLDRPVALKLLVPYLALDKDFVARFRREARAAAALNHPNLVQVYDFGEHEGTWFYAMEFVDGLSLGDHLRRGQSFTEAECIQIGLQTAAALEAAHAAGIVHRDLKPDNLILASSGLIKVSDLGLARVRDASADSSLTMSGVSLGTPFYIAPEQVRGARDVDCRADYYSLGATLFHLACGRPPFEGETPAVIMSRHLNDPTPWARDPNPDLSEGFAALLFHLMAKNPDERPPDAAALQAQLESCQTGETQTLGRLVARARRHRHGFRIPLGLATALLLALAAASGWWWTWRQLEDRGHKRAERRAENVAALNTPPPPHEAPPLPPTPQPPPPADRPPPQLPPAIPTPAAPTAAPVPSVPADGPSSVRTRPAPPTQEELARVRAAFAQREEDVRAKGRRLVRRPGFAHNPQWLGRLPDDGPALTRECAVFLPDNPVAEWFGQSGIPRDALRRMRAPQPNNPGVGMFAGVIFTEVTEPGIVSLSRARATGPKPEPIGVPQQRHLAAGRLVDVLWDITGMLKEPAEKSGAATGWLLRYDGPGTAYLPVAGELPLEFVPRLEMILPPPLFRRP